MNGDVSVFVDTNVLLYQLSGSSPTKQVAASRWLDALWSARAAHLSWQVIHEFYSAAVRKLRIPASKARLLAEQMVQIGPEPVRMETVRRAWHWCDRAQLNYWDALIVAAAEQSGCQWLLSEDFQAGRKFDSVTVVNPFEHAPEEFELV